MANARIRLALDGVQGVIGGLGQVGDRIGSVTKSIGALTAIGGTLTFGAFAAWIKGSIDAADATSKLSAKIGVAVRDVAGLELSYKLSGLSADLLSTSMAKLSTGIVTGNKALDALGIQSKNTNGTFKTTRAMLAEVADKFANLKDGSQKTALAVQIFGKAGADMIPLLNGGAAGLADMDEKALKLGLTLSDSTVKQAEEFNDALDLMKLRVTGAANEIAAELLPTLVDLMGALEDTNEAGNKLYKDGTITAWSDDAAVGVARLIDVFKLIPRTISAISSSFGVVGADINYLKVTLEGLNPFSPSTNDDIIAASEARVAAIAEANKKYDDLWNKPANLVEQAILDRIDIRTGVNLDARDYQLMAITASAKKSSGSIKNGRHT